MFKIICFGNTITKATNRCFAYRASVYFRNCQRSYSKLISRQLNKQMLLPPFKTTVREINVAFSCLNSFLYTFGAKRPLLCSAIKRFSMYTGEENNHTKQQNIQKFSFSKDQKPAFSPGPNDDHWGPFIMNRIHGMEESSRWHGYNMLRWGLSVLFMLLTSIYLFRDQLRDNVADEVADVASRSMADENVVLTAHGMTKDVLERLVSEPETINLASDFITQVLEKQDLRETAVAFASSVLEHPDTQAKIQEITWSTIHTILNNEETKRVLLTFIKSLIDDEQTREACQLLLVSLTKDTAIQQVVSEFFKSVLASPDFQTEAVLLGRAVTDKIVNDEHIQKETGDALWNAVKHGVTPYYFRR